MGRLRATAAVWIAGLLPRTTCGAAAFVPTPHGRTSSPSPPVASTTTRPRPRRRSALFRSGTSDEGADPPSIAAGGGIAPRLHRTVASAVASAALCAAVVASPVDVRWCVDAPQPGSHHRWPAPPSVSVARSDARAVTENQRLVGDVWFAVTAQFFDPTYNGLGEDGWRAREREAMAAVADAGPDDDAVVGRAIADMLGALDDPYTRFLPRERYEALTAYATGGGAGGGAGIGVQLLEDPRTGRVTVMATAKGGPAESAGVRAGDAIVGVDGESTAGGGASAEAVAAKCRGEPGTKVDVQIVHQDMDDGGRKKTKESVERVTLTRARINPNPLETSTFVSAGGKRVGVLRVPSFSTNTVREMVDGLRTVMTSSDTDGGGGRGVDALAVDLRGNVGGYMPAGVDAAKLFLPARAHVVAEIGPGGRGSMVAYDANGVGAETSLPVYLLVDGRTASAAEIFAAALQDNRRGLVVGTGRTFGKGRIQNVQAVGGGAGVAVTRARYVTPSGRDLHGVGIAPDREPTGGCGVRDDARECLGDIVDAY